MENRDRSIIGAVGSIQLATIPPDALTISISWEFLPETNKHPDFFRIKLAKRIGKSKWI